MRLILTALASVMAIVPAVAGEYAPVVWLQPERTVIEGQALDVMGLVTGMTPPEVEAWFAEKGQSEFVRTNSSALEVEKDGITISTVPFVDRIWTDASVVNGNDQSETYDLAFTGPASGNQLVHITRKVDFKNSSAAPLLRDVLESLLEKYGKPVDGEQNGSMLTMYWRFMDGERFKCTTQCIDRVGYQHSDLQTMMAEPLDGGDAMVKVVVQGQTRVSSLELEVRDMNKVSRAAEADFLSIWEEAERQLTAAPASKVQF